LTDVGCSHGCNIILMVRDDSLNCCDFLLGGHTGTFNFLFSIGNQKWYDAGVRTLSYQDVRKGKLAITPIKQFAVGAASGARPTQ